jgi:hypothetical protein
LILKLKLEIGILKWGLDWGWDVSRETWGFNIYVFNILTDGGLGVDIIKNM